MVEQALYEAITGLAEKNIPEGTHKFLHINSREFWTDLMLELIESGVIKKRMSILARCALNWEVLLVQKISIQN